MTRTDIEKCLKDFIQIEINYRTDCEVAYPFTDDPNIDEKNLKNKYRQELITARVHASVVREQRLANLAPDLYNAVRLLLANKNL